MVMGPSLNSGQQDEENEVVDEQVGGVGGRNIIHEDQTYRMTRRQRRQIMASGSASASRSADQSTQIHDSQLHLDEIRQLVISCGDLISRSDLGAAHRLLSVLSAKSSPYGDSTERLLHHFSRALLRRLTHARHINTLIPYDTMLNTVNTAATITTAASSQQATANYMMMTARRVTTSTNVDVDYNYEDDHDHDHDEDNMEYDDPSQSDDDHIHSCYLTLNQITPFIRFSHLTANQAILEAIEEGTQAVHIVDLDIMHGLQWPPFMQALADRSSPAPSLRITATGYDLPLLRRTGDRLLRFSHSLGIRFHFQPLLLPADHDAAINLIMRSNTNTNSSHEALAVNCVLYLHRLLDDHDHHSHKLRRFLQGIKALNPRVVTVAEREANLVGPQALTEALDHYAAIFDSLEATLPPNSRERLAVEQLWLSREIAAAVPVALPVPVPDDRGTSTSRSRRRLRSQRYESWEALLRSCGFSNVPLSPFALSQAKLLLRLHYPSEGFQLHILNHSFFLGWQNRPLYSLSSWH